MIHDPTPYAPDDLDLDDALEQTRRPEGPPHDGFTITTMDEATWAAKKAAAANTHLDRIKAWQQREIQRITEVADHAKSKHQATLDRMTDLLAAYLRRSIEDGSVKRRSLKLDGGTIKLRKRDPKLNVDATALVLWAENNNHPDLIRTKKEVDLATLKKRATLADAGMVVIDGEILPDVTWEPQEDAAAFAPEGSPE